MRRETVAGLVIEIRQVLAAAFVFRIAVGIELQLQWVGFLVELAFHVASQVEVTSVGNALQLAVLTRIQKRKRVFNIGRAG